MENNEKNRTERIREFVEKMMNGPDEYCPGMIDAQDIIDFIDSL